MKFPCTSKTQNVQLLNYTIWQKFAENSDRVFQHTVETFRGACHGIYQLHALDGLIRDYNCDPTTIRLRRNRRKCIAYITITIRLRCNYDPTTSIRMLPFDAIRRE